MSGDRRLSMLLVEDDPARAVIAGRVIAGLRLRIGLTTFVRGEDALAHLQKSWLLRTGLPDIVLSDVHLPGISGYDVCRSIKASGYGSHFPVAVYTWTPKPEDVELAHRAGADAVLNKHDMARVVLGAINLINPVGVLERQHSH